MLEKLKRGLDRMVDVAGICMLTVLVVVVVAQVVSRYVFNRPFTWSEELSRFLLVWIVYIFTSIAFRENRHLGIDFFVKLFPASLRLIVDAVMSTLVFLFLVMLLGYGMELIGFAMDQPSAALGVPMGIVYLSFPVAAVLMMLEQIYRLYELIARRSSS